MPFLLDNLKITFYGTRGFVKEKSRFHRYNQSVLFEVEGKKLLVDYGQENQNNFEKIKPDYFLLTHAHPDHCLGLTTLKEPVKIYGSKETKRVLKEKYQINVDKFKVLKPYQKTKLGPFQITKIPVVHSVIAPASAFIIGYRDVTILIATDLAFFPSSFKTYLRQQPKLFDLAIIDGSSIDRDLIRKRKTDGKLYGHAATLKIISALKNFVKYFIVSHLGSQAILKGRLWVRKRISEKFPLLEFSVAVDEQSGKPIEIQKLAPLIVIGSGSLDAFPKESCRDSLCVSARKGGKDLRLPTAIFYRGVLFDIGVGIWDKVKKYQPKAIVLSHCHFDHLGDLLWFKELTKNTPVYAYEKNKTLLESLGIKARYFKNEFQIDNLKIQAREIIHSWVTPTVIFKFDRVVYAPDVGDLSKEDLKWARDARIWLGDGFSLDQDYVIRGQKLHLSLEKQIQRLKALKLLKVFIALNIGHHSRYPHEQYELLLTGLSIQKNVPFLTEIGFDGLRLNIFYGSHSNN